MFPLLVEVSLKVFGSCRKKWFVSTNEIERPIHCSSAVSIVQCRPIVLLRAVHGNLFVLNQWEIETS